MPQTAGAGTTASIGAAKNEIKVSTEGVAKLSFTFLDELHADSSLEPGEVKTPPQSPLSTKSNLKSPALKSEIVQKNENARRDSFKIVSQLDAAAFCKDKVRAILELDEINRRKEKEQMEKQKEQRRESKDTKKSKSSKRKKSKKKEVSSDSQKKSICSDDDTAKLPKRSKKNDRNASKKKKKKHHKEHKHDSDTKSSERKVLATSSDRIEIPSRESSYFHENNIQPSPSVRKFRPMNPFCRPPRHEFPFHGRGGFNNRGRGFMRGGAHRFPEVNHQGPHNFHGPRYYNRTTDSNTNQPSAVQEKEEDWDSPEKLIPESKLETRWTKAQPSLPYAFNIIKLVESENANLTESKLITTKSPPKETKKEKSKEKLNTKSRKEKKSKRRRSSSEKSKKKKIEKIRELEKNTRLQSEIFTPTKGSPVTTTTVYLNDEFNQQKFKNKHDASLFDMFADSPPRHSHRKITEKSETNIEILIPNDNKISDKPYEAYHTMGELSTTPPPQNSASKIERHSTVPIKKDSLYDIPVKTHQRINRLLSFDHKEFNERSSSSISKEKREINPHNPFRDNSRNRFRDFSNSSEHKRISRSITKEKDTFTFNRKHTSNEQICMPFEFVKQRFRRGESFSNHRSSSLKRRSRSEEKQNSSHAFNSKTYEDKKPASEKKLRKSFKKTTSKTDKKSQKTAADQFDFPAIKMNPAKNDDSPDTDDYMDNWETDDIELNTNAAFESSSTPKQSPNESIKKNSETNSSKDKVSPAPDDVFDKQLFVNPSPPSAYASEDGGLTPPPIIKIERKSETPKRFKNLEDIPLCDPKDAHITNFNIALLKKERETSPEKTTSSSLENSKQPATLFGMQEIYDQFIRSVEESGVDMKSTCVDNNDDKEKEENTLLQNFTEKENITAITKPILEGDVYASSTSTASSSRTSSSSSSSSSTSTSSSSDDSNDAANFKNNSEEEKIITQTNTNSVITQKQKPAQKSEVAKDFKKVKSLEANLARIKLMRSNYDSADEISEELLKMENLFLQEKKLILQKYAKTSSDDSNQTEVKSDSQIQDSTIEIETNKIFDTNREAIRITISPSKLPKTIPNAREKHKDEEMDFTEKLLKPVKEVAIVKPMMEAIELRSPHKRSPATSDRNYHHRPSSRSTARPRARSISVSPPRSRRFHSPGRRVSGTTSSHSSHSGRWRGSRYTRSRSRSLTRHFRRSDISPIYRRKRLGSRKIRSKHSRSRSHSLSPVASHERRRSRSSSYGRGYSRSPLPFKPPSPPMRQSSSPETRRSRKSRSRSHSRSPTYNSYSSQEQYYSQNDSTSSSYYYNVSPNRISLDARINIVLNDSNQDQSITSASSNSNLYAAYNYNTYGYMAVPPQPGQHPVNYQMNYANQYVPMAETQHVYSNIPTIGTSNLGQTEETSNVNNYYYGNFDQQSQQQPHPQQQPPLLKEVPKAPVAVQKGNVLEIVPSEMPSVPPQKSTTPNFTPVPIKSEDNVNASISSLNRKCKKPKSKKVPTISWKEEVSSRHVASAVLRLNRENEGLSRGILKNVVQGQSSVEKPKKKVYFEDGIFPNRDSDDEDRKAVDIKIRRKLKLLRRQHGIKSNKENQENCPSNIVESTLDMVIKIDPELVNAPPPPPPPGSPPARLEQPIYLRPPTPTPYFYFHFDAVVHSMYVSQMETPIPPRLLNPKLVPPTPQTATTSSVTVASPITVAPAVVSTPSTATVVVTTISPSPIISPSTGTMITSCGGKKEASIVRSNQSEQSSPKSITTSKVPPLRESPKASPIETVVNTARHSSSSPVESLLSPRSFVSIGPISANVPIHVRHSPMGFPGMRMNSFARLPPSPLTRAPMQPMHGVGLRHPYNVPPPNMGNVPPSQIMQSDMSPQYHHQHQHHHHHHHHHIQHQPVQLPPPMHPMQPMPPMQPMQHHPHQHPPQFYMRGPQPMPLRGPLLPNPPSHHSPNFSAPMLQHLAVNNGGCTPPHPGPQAMIAPFNINRQ